METFAAVNEANEPPTISGRFESYLEISLMSMSIFVPSCDGVTIVAGGSLLMHNEVTVAIRRDVEHVIEARNRVYVPLQVILVDPRPSRDSCTIIGFGTEQVKVGSYLTLNGDGDIGVGKSKRRSVVHN